MLPQAAWACEGCAAGRGVNKVAEAEINCGPGPAHAVRCQEPAAPPVWGVSGLYASSQAQARTSVGWLAPTEKEGEEEVCKEGINGGRRGCHDRPHGESPEPGCPFPPAAS